MPSTKPQILIRTDQYLIDKLDKIAKSQNRSRGNLAETILKEYVIKYELENGSLDESITGLRTPIDEYKILNGTISNTMKKHTMSAIQMSPDRREPVYETAEKIENEFARLLMEKYENETL